MRQWSDEGKTVMHIGSEGYTVRVTGSFSKYKDGEDADGNRGWYVTDLDEVEIIDISPEPSEADRLLIEERIGDLDPEDFVWRGDDE